MEWLNYHHLLYFWTVARTGSVAAASKELRLAPPTISNQIGKLEESLGESSFAVPDEGWFSPIWAVSRCATRMRSFR